MVASLLRAITATVEGHPVYPSARILMLDIHGEYAGALADVAQVFSVDGLDGKQPLYIPYWALDTDELLGFLTGAIEGHGKTAFTDKIMELKHEALLTLVKGVSVLGINNGVPPASITVDTPLPFSLKRLWHELIDFELMTLKGNNRDQPALIEAGDANNLSPPTYKPHGMGSAGPFLNQHARGIQRHLRLLRSRLLDHRYDFLLHPGCWEPNLEGIPEQDLDSLVCQWLGGDRPVTILDLSGVPSNVLDRLVGSILNIVYEALFWARRKPEGGIDRPLLIVLEEAHRYLATGSHGMASKLAQRLVKEGRKYGVGAMIVSQRPSEVEETILSQCGTFFTMRLTNPSDRLRVQSAMPDSLAGLLEVVPVLRTGEMIVTGEATNLPMRCRVALPSKTQRPESEDPLVGKKWSMPRRDNDYISAIRSWRKQNPFE